MGWLSGFTAALGWRGVRWAWILFAIVAVKLWLANCGHEIDAGAILRVPLDTAIDLLFSACLLSRVMPSACISVLPCQELASPGDLGSLRGGFTVTSGVCSCLFYC